MPNSCLAHCHSLSLTPCSCYTGGFDAYWETPGACTLYSLANGYAPALEQQGDETLWVSGAPPGKAPLPFTAPAKPGICAPHEYVMLAGEYIGGSQEDSVDGCCARCANTPNCAAYSYCPLQHGDQ